MKLSIFSNGQTDEYKGSRNVTAGWAVISTITNKIVKSGHSMTFKLAEKNATSSMRLHQVPTGRIAATQYTKEDIDFIKSENSKYKATHKIEVVNL